MHTFDCWLICIISYIRSVDVDGFRVFVCVFAFGLSIHVSNVFRCLTVVAPCALSLYLSGLVCRTIEFPRFSLFIRNERLLSACQKKKSSSSLRHRHIYTRIIKEKKKHKHLKLYRYRFCLGWNKPHYDQFRREWKHELTRNATRQTLVIMPLQCFFYFCRCTKWLVVCSRLEQRSVFSDNVRLNDGWVVCAVHVPYSAVATDDDWNWIELYWNDIHDVFQFRCLIVRRIHFFGAYFSYIRYIFLYTRRMAHKLHFVDPIGVRKLVDYLFVRHTRHKDFLTCAYWWWSLNNFHHLSFAALCFVKLRAVDGFLRHFAAYNIY